MKHQSTLALRMEICCKPNSSKTQACVSDRLKTRPMDVVSMKGCSETGLYVLEKGGAKPLLKDEKTNGTKLLARTRGLSSQEKAELKEQNVEIIYLREAGVDLQLILSSQKYEGREDMWGTEVVPYIVVNENQAKSIRAIAEDIPKKEVKEYPAHEPLNLPKAALEHLGWCMVNGGV